ncbi:MAG: hypothetical protein CM1200mP32_02300 [Methanobacteriota archaeon]|nr:MAG: hypothetical protein CM1200mP32_02300 [Euryarchaeota archaeon]
MMRSDEEETANWFSWCIPMGTTCSISMNLLPVLRMDMTPRGGAGTPMGRPWTWGKGGNDRNPIYEFAELGEIMSDDDEGDDGDDEEGDDEPFRVTMMVMGQTLNAPISDFEVRFLFDCGEPDEEGNEPPISDCSIAASNGLTEGSAAVDPAIAEYEFTYEYLDYDGDGLISDMDTLVIDNLMPDVRSNCTTPGQTSTHRIVRQS